jgi:pyridoxine 4-dehydrogenase
MRMTWVPVPTPDEVAFEAIKAGVDTLPAGAKMILNTGMTQMDDLTLS